MKRFNIFALLLFTVFLIAGCSSNSSQDSVVVDLGNKLDQLDSYHITADMTIQDRATERLYQLDMKFEKPELYKVELTNVATSNKQIIVKNDEGVFVLTPSLNKSFKFNSDWPMKGNHVYLFQSLIKDIINAEDPKINEDGDIIIIETKVESELDPTVITQKVHINKETLEPKMVEVLDENGEVLINVNFSSVKFGVEHTENEFNVSTIMENSRDEGVEEPTERNISYPTYFPLGTYLIDEDIMETRGVMTFGGDHSFTVMQEFVDDSDTVSTTNILGDILILKSGYGSITSSSISWVENGIDYMIFSDTLSSNELIKIANSFIQNSDK